VRWFLVGLAACGARAPTPREHLAEPTEGVSIAIYAKPDQTYAVIDDRRWVEVAGDEIVLDRIDGSAPLQSLVIEPIGASIQVGACMRERIDDSAEGLASLAEARGARPKKVIVIHDSDAGEPYHLEDSQTIEPPILARPSVLSPLVRCRVKGRAGKYLVRVMQVTTSTSFVIKHDVTMTSADRASVVTRFAITTPSWQGQRAQVSLFDGQPGAETPPTELTSGVVILDGSTGLLASAPREVTARLRSVYDGAKLEDEEEIKPDDIVWGRESRHQVWVWLEVDGAVPAGPVRAHVEMPDHATRDVEIAAELRQVAPMTGSQAPMAGSQANFVVRWPLWIDEDLVGSRKRRIDRADGVVITDSVDLAVSNLGTQSREVWVEERLRPSKRRSLQRSWPSKPAFSKGVARTKLVLAPGQTERLGFTIDYEF
jgi:hypothetical protein